MHNSTSDQHLLNNLSDLEQTLAKLLLPVEPRPEFISGLRQRLEHSASRGQVEKHSMQSGLLVVISGLGLLLLIVIGVKLILWLVPVISRFRHRQNRMI